jgi:hypothetical protein
MKKILMTLGFATATLFAVHAQETPQPQEEQEQIPEQQQEYPQEQQQQQEQYSQQQDTTQIEGETVQKLDTTQLPQEVTQALNESEYQGASIENAYKLSGDAIDVLMDLNAYEIYAGDVGPETLYMLRVMHEDKPAIIYLTEEGEVYATKELEMGNTEN